MSQTFYISVTETLSKVVRVEAADVFEAIEKVEEGFCEKYSLDPINDFVDRQVDDETDEWDSMIQQNFCTKENFQEIK